MIYIIIVFLAIAIVFYCLFAGADFGAGILDLFTHRDEAGDMSDVIGPVWEANHVWLILAVVILFMGFPKVYSTVTLYLHIPILLLLIGIILRGTAFAFMHYDAVQDRSNAVYQWVFKLSSLITPFFLGTTVGALVLGDINPQAETFYAAYVAPWFNGFSFSVGFFCICLFTFLASIFMIGELGEKQSPHFYIRAAKIAQLSTVLSGALVSFTSWLYDGQLFVQFIHSWIALACIALATVSLWFIWNAVNRQHVWLSRIIAGAQVSLILFAWFWIQHPVVVNLKNAPDITFLNSVAPEATLLQLLLALLVGLCLILPGLFILFRTFKSRGKSSVQP